MNNRTIDALTIAIKRSRAASLEAQALRLRREAALMEAAIIAKNPNYLRTAGFPLSAAKDAVHALTMRDYPNRHR